MLIDYSDRVDEISSMIVITRFTTAPSEALSTIAWTSTIVFSREAKSWFCEHWFATSFIAATLRKRGLPFMQMSDVKSSILLSESPRLSVSMSVTFLSIGGPMATFMGHCGVVQGHDVADAEFGCMLQSIGYCLCRALPQRSHQSMCLCCHGSRHNQADAVAIRHDVVDDSCTNTSHDA